MAETPNSIQNEQLRLSALEAIRVEVPARKILFAGKAEGFFDILPNTTDLTEEFLYAHQPVSGRTIPVYGPSIEPMGHLDESEARQNEFAVLLGPVIVVARKGYAGRLIVVTAKSLIVHEDAYAIRPKSKYADAINLEWFAGHYSAEFQANRTALWGIGDFPRERFESMHVVIPHHDFQEAIAPMYARRRSLIERHRTLREDVEANFRELLNRT
ncbi:MAG TPA: hypothetical protein VEU62_00140 [Bryobacterales bacterium]|nr:hypothetical protein [Bryobacterales bacterium]